MSNKLYQSVCWGFWASVVLSLAVSAVFGVGYLLAYIADNYGIAACLVSFTFLVAFPSLTRKAYKDEPWKKLWNNPKTTP